MGSWGYLLRFAGLSSECCGVSVVEISFPDRYRTMYMSMGSWGYLLRFAGLLSECCGVSVVEISFPIVIERCTCRWVRGVIFLGLLGYHLNVAALV